MKILTICIPTFNRSDLAYKCVVDTISKVEKYNIPVIVSDNYSEDDTFERISALNYKYLSLYKQEENIGPDRNFEFCLKKSESKYSLILGDSYLLDENELENLVHFLSNESYSVIVTNSEKRVKYLQDKLFTNIDELVNQIGWHMTVMSGLIFSKELIFNASFERYRGTSFLQTGIIFEYLYVHFGTCFFINKQFTLENKLALKSGLWLPKAFQVFGKGWVDFVLSLPAVISLESKKKCISDHDKYTGLFNIYNLLNYRRSGYFNKNTLQSMKEYLPFFLNVPLPIVYLISILPLFLVNFLLSLIESISKNRF